MKGLNNKRLFNKYLVVTFSDNYFFCPLSFCFSHVLRFSLFLSFSSLLPSFTSFPSFPLSVPLSISFLCLCLLLLFLFLVFLSLLFNLPPSSYKNTVRSFVQKSFVRSDNYPFRLFKMMHSGEIY